MDRALFERLATSFDALLGHVTGLCPHLDRRLRGGVSQAGRPLSLVRVPYGFLDGPGERADVFRLGDQVGVIPYLAGDGVSGALHSAHLAVGMFLRGQSPAAFHRRIRREMRGQMAAASLLFRGGRLAFGGAAIGGVVRLVARLLG